MDDRIHKLTLKEKQVLEFIKEGKSSKEIAGLMNISSNTIENHRASIIKKLELNGPNALMRYLMNP